MNHVLFAASVGHRMKLGLSLGEALFEAAVNHERECREWSEASKLKYDGWGNVILDPGVPTLGEFITAFITI